MNHNAWSIAKKISEQAEKFGVMVKRTKSGTTIIDAGIKAKGGLEVGRLITEICLGGYGTTNIFYKRYDDLELPSIFVYTDHPAVSTLGSQFAGWRINMEKYTAIASGPARALASKPKELYEKIQHSETSDLAVLVLETTKVPPENVISYISNECKVEPDCLSLILVPTSTITGSTQISGRIVETGVYRLMELGFDPRLITHACGYAPIAPVHPKFNQAMGRTNDAIIYAGTAYLTTSCDDDEKLCRLVEKGPSSVSKSYGKPFFEIFKEADYDFYNISPDLFAPAIFLVNNSKTGMVFKAGKINMMIFKRSIGLRA